MITTGHATSGDVARLLRGGGRQSSVGTWCGWRVYVGGRAVRYNRIVASDDTESRLLPFGKRNEHIVRCPICQKLFAFYGKKIGAEHAALVKHFGCGSCGSKRRQSEIGPVSA